MIIAEIIEIIAEIRVRAVAPCTTWIRVIIAEIIEIIAEIIVRIAESCEDSEVCGT